MTHAAAAGAVEPAEPGRLTSLHSRTGAALITATVCASSCVFLDAYVINVAVPAIGRDLGGSVTSLQWVLTSHLLTVASLLLVAGALIDRFGRRRILVIGLIVMFLASILCAAAPTIQVLIAARVLQGVGSAMVTPGSLALLNGTLRVSDRARGIGFWAGLATISSTVGPYVGGWLVDHASWRWVFVLNIPLILVALLALRLVPESTATRSLSPDVLGALLGVLGLGGVIYALNESSSAGWSSVQVVVALVVGALSLAGLVVVELRSRAPMLLLSLFSSRQFDAINATTVLYYGALAAAGYLLILQCELRLGYTAAQAGAALIPSSAVFLAISPLSGALVSRIGPRWLMVAGILIVGASFLWLSRAHPGSSYAEAILPGALLHGLGLGLSVTPLTAAVLAAVDDRDLGEASAINEAASRVGAVIAIAVVPTLIGISVGQSFEHALEGGFQPAMIALAGICGAGALITALFVTDKRAEAPPIAPVALVHACAPHISEAV